MNGESTAVQKSEKQPINIDMSKGVLPINYTEVMQMAALIHSSGLAPKSLDTIQKVAVAMMMAMEVGLPVVTGIQHVAVINGKAGIWGDATIALVRASGMMADGYPIEKETGTPYTDSWTFHCTVKRRGGPEVTGSFSWSDAKKAGLDNPQLRGGGKDVYSPWTRFPKRMMQWKARQWVYRDEFGDVLRGMKMAEELYDYIDMESKANGTTWEPGTPRSEFDYEAFREDLIENNGFIDKDIDAFEEKLSSHYKKSIEEIRQQIGNDQEAYIKSLTAWCVKNGTPHPPVQKKTDPIRDEYINLRSAGYSSWVHENLERIKEFDVVHQAEIVEKWAKLYEGIPFPLSKEEPSSSYVPVDEKGWLNEEDDGNEEPSWIICPITEMSVDAVTKCPECEEDCQVYQAWKMENGTGEKSA